MRHKTTALTVLLAGCISAYGWQFVPDQYTSFAWYVTQSIWQVALLALLAVVYRSLAMVAVCSLMSCFSLMVAGCEIAYNFNPWPKSPGSELCSAGLNYPLGLLGAVIALVLVVSIVRGEK